MAFQKEFHEKTDHYVLQYKSNPFISFYSYKVLDKAVSLSKVKEGERVLDFGCGRKELKKKLPTGTEYTGYDLVEKYSDIKSYKGFKADKIFALNVLHYLTPNQLSDISKDFAEISNTLIVQVPVENFFKKHFLEPLAGLKNLADSSFVSDIKTVYNCLSENFSLEKESNIFWLSKVSLWKKKN